jgi:glucosamine kinase
VAEAAAAEAGLTLPAAAVFAGVAGAGRSTARDALRTALEKARLGERIRVGTDVEAAAYDALESGPGVVLLAGTGSIAWGRSQDGRTDRVGGWGKLLGDEGSGYALGLEALRAVLRAEDGRDPTTSLTSGVLEATGVADPPELVLWADRAGKREIAALATVVVGHSSRDAVARLILEDGADDLVRQAAVLVERLGPWPRGTVTVALAGGLLGRPGPYRDRVLEGLRGLSLGVSEASVDAARGAGLLAIAMLA